MRGTNKLFSRNWITMVVPTTQINFVGDMDKAMIPAGIAPRTGPIIGTASRIPAMSARTKAFGRPISK
jgi:hypothetical protein